MPEPSGRPFEQGAGPLLEREAELDELRSALAAAQGGWGRAILLEGPAGIGKTRLLAAVRTEAEAARARVLRAAGSRLERDFTYGVARQLLEPALARARAEDRERLLVQRRIAGLDPADAGAPAADVWSDADALHDDRAYTVLSALHEIVAHLAGPAPLVALVDDVHWADAPSLRFLHFLARRLDSLPALVVLAGRPAAEWKDPDLHAAFEAEPHLTVLRLGPLSLEGTAAILQRALGDAASAGLAPACHEATGGNPLYLGELAREIAGRDAPSGDLDAEAIERMGPQAVRRSVLGRIAALAEPAAALARALAVCDGRAASAAAPELAGLDPATASRAADELRAVDVLEHGPELAFAHPVVRAAVYESIPPGDRARLHARAAELMRERGAPLDAVCAQILASDPGLCADAVETLRRGAAEAMERGAPDVAAVHLERALAEAPPRPLRARVLLELGTAEALQRRPGTPGHLAEAIELADEPDDRLLATLALWTTRSFAGQVPEGFDLLRSAFAASEGASPELVLRVELELARAARSCRTTAAEGRARIARLRERLDESSTLGRLALGLVAYDAMLANAPAHEVVALVERALPLDDAILARSDSQLLQLPIYTLIWCDELERATRLLDEVAAAARRRGSAIGEPVEAVWRALILLRTGDIPAARASARRGLEAAEENGWPFGLAAGRRWLAEAALEAGELDEAERHYSALMRLATPSLQVKGWTHHIRHGRARLRLARGDAAAALEELLAVGRLHEEWLARSPSEMPWRSDAALAARAAGDTRLAKRLAAEEVELARAMGGGRTVGIALRVSGVVAGGREGLARLEEAVDVLARSPARLEHARALTELGVALRRSRDARAAREPLRAALDAALRCGGVALAERARTELIASGARPRRSTVSGVDALSAAEWRVARLAAEGAGNRAIAAALFLSQKTVEAHLSNSYRKLGIRSRRELADALGDALAPDATPEAATR